MCLYQQYHGKLKSGDFNALLVYLISSKYTANFSAICQPRALLLSSVQAHAHPQSANELFVYPWWTKRPISSVRMCTVSNIQTTGTISYCQLVKKCIV